MITLANNSPVPNSEGTQFRSGEQAVQMGQKGGFASGEARRRKRNTRETLEIISQLAFNIKSKKGPDLKSMLIEQGIKEEDIDYDMAMNFSMYVQAMSGKNNSVQAAQYIRDSLGDKPADSVNVEVNDSKKLKDVFEQIGGEGLDE